MSGSAPIRGSLFPNEQELSRRPAWSRTLIGIFVESFLSVDFSKAALSKASRRQLVEIVHAVRRQGGAGRTGLKNLILQNVFDPKRGIDVPVAADFYLKGKLPEISRTLEGEETSGALKPFPAPLFTNALLIPPGYGADGFRPDEAPRPLERATNAGFLIVTIEFDCQGPEQFEEKLIWIRSPDGDGNFARSPFADLDRDLQRAKEYRGFSIVFSGNRSLHFHFIFSTEHLQNVPSGAVAGDRRVDFRRASAILHNVHNQYWDHADEVFVRILKSSMPADRKLRSLTQWRRAPWGLRSSEDDLLLGLGTPVPQLVLRERILPRAPRGNAGFLVPEFFAWPILSERFGDGVKASATSLNSTNRRWSTCLPKSVRPNGASGRSRSG